MHELKPTMILLSCRNNVDFIISGAELYISSFSSVKNHVIAEYSLNKMQSQPNQSITLNGRVINIFDWRFHDFLVIETFEDVLCLWVC